MKFSTRESTDKFELSKLTPYQRKLIEFNQTYKLSFLKSESELQFSSYRLNGAYGAMQIIKRNENKNFTIRLTLDSYWLNNPETYFKNKMFAIAHHESAYVDKNNIMFYTLAHEYGHLVEEDIIKRRFNKHKDTGIDYSNFRDLEATRIKNEVVKIYKKRYNNDDIYLSTYANEGGDFEWFAETFTNLQLADKPAPIALALDEYLRRNLYGNI